MVLDRLRRGVAVSFSVKGVTSSYPQKRELHFPITRPAAPSRADEVALRDVTIELPGGVTIAVLGPSGSGKTTLLNLLGLLWEERLPKGDICYNGTVGRSYNELTRGEKVQ